MYSHFHCPYVDLQGHLYHLLFSCACACVSRYMFIALNFCSCFSTSRVRFHYGHPDVFDRIFHLTRGGVSKASKVINLSEDIFAGMLIANAFSFNFVGLCA